MISEHLRKLKGVYVDFTECQDLGLALIQYVVFIHEAAKALNSEASTQGEA